MKGWRMVLGAAVFAASVAAPVPARAEFWSDAGWGSLTALSNVLYMPAKLIYGMFGGLTGGMAYGLTGGDYETAQNIWTPALGGTYVLTPRMLQGQDPISFAAMPTDPAAPESPPPPAASGISEQRLGAL